MQDEWEKSAQIRKEIELDEFVIMPNHIHGIVVITDTAERATGRSPLHIFCAFCALGCGFAARGSTAVRISPNRNSVYLNYSAIIPRLTPINFFLGDG